MWARTLTFTSPVIGAFYLGERTLYKKLVTTRIIRTKHQVSFKEEWGAASVKRSLSHVPDGASIEEIDCDDGFVTITFVEDAPDSGKEQTKQDFGAALGPIGAAALRDTLLADRDTK